MSYKLFISGLLLTLLNWTEAQILSQEARDSIYDLTKADHNLMKQVLGIEVPNRPGPSGDPNAPNATNNNEARVNSYDLSNPLQMESGQAVKTEDDWWQKRRPEIVELFEREIYGRIPENVPVVNWEVVAEKDTSIGNFPVQEKRLKGIVDNSAYPEIEVEMDLLVVTPAAVDRPVPLVLHFGFITWPFGPSPDLETSIFSPADPNWKEQLISRGYGYGIIVPSSIQADHGAGLRSGIIGLTNKAKARKPDDWGALRAWAWGASRAMDYLESDADVDQERVAIEGLSRYGKAALVTMAYDQRFSLGFIGSSGAGGAKILRRNFGEQVENLAGTGEYHWFCGNFIKYASTRTVHDLPVDAHQLVALCAPRPVFISAGSPLVEGEWVDAKGMFLAGVHAGPVYNLLDKKGLGTDEFPIIGTPLMDGEIAFRQHAGGHTTGPNWSTWIAWACRYWGDCRYK